MASKTVVISAKQIKAQSKVDAVAKAARAAIYARTTTQPASVPPSVPQAKGTATTSATTTAVASPVKASVKPLAKAKDKSGEVTIVATKGRTLYYCDSFATNALLGRAMYYAFYALQLGVSALDASNAKFPIGKVFASPTSKVKSYWVTTRGGIWNDAGPGKASFSAKGQSAFSEYITLHGAIPQNVMADMLVAVDTGKASGTLAGKQFYAKVTV